MNIFIDGNRIKTDFRFAANVTPRKGETVDVKVPIENIPIGEYLILKVVHSIESPGMGTYGSSYRHNLSIYLSSK